MTTEIPEQLRAALLDWQTADRQEEKLRANYEEAEKVLKCAWSESVPAAMLAFSWAKEAWEQAYSELRKKKAVLHSAFEACTEELNVKVT